MNRCFPFRVFALCCAIAVPGAYGFEWQNHPGYRTAPLPANAGAKTGFTRLDGLNTGILFTNQLPERRYLTNQVYLNGSGIAAGDIDGDGDLDLIVNSVGMGTHLFFNDGKGRFTASPAAPLNPDKGGTSVALADIDGDGDLDLYIANYRSSTIRDQPNTRYRVKEINGRLEVLLVNDRPVTEPDLAGRFVFEMNGRMTENGEVDAFFRNDGDGRFTLIPFTEGAFIDEAGTPWRSLRTTGGSRLSSAI